MLRQLGETWGVEYLEVPEDLWARLTAATVLRLGERHWALKTCGPGSKSWTIPFWLCVLGPARQTPSAWIWGLVSVCHWPLAFSDLLTGSSARAFLDPSTLHFNSHHTVDGWWYRTIGLRTQTREPNSVGLNPSSVTYWRWLWITHPTCKATTRIYLQGLL